MLLIRNIALLQTPQGNMSRKGQEQRENRKYRGASILIYKQVGISEPGRMRERLYLHPKIRKTLA